MMHRPWVTFFLGMFFGAAIVVAAAQRQFEDNINSQVITNTEKIIDLQRQINDLAEWRNQHVRDSYTDNAVLVGNVRELEVTVAEHEKLLWVLVTSVVALMIKTLAEVVSRRKGNGHGHDHGGGKEIK